MSLISFLVSFVIPVVLGVSVYIGTDYITLVGSVFSLIKATLLLCFNCIYSNISFTDKPGPYTPLFTLLFPFPFPLWPRYISSRSSSRTSWLSSGSAVAEFFCSSSCYSSKFSFYYEGLSFGRLPSV